jgi:hypothetical protein
MVAVAAVLILLVAEVAANLVLAKAATLVEPIEDWVVRLGASLLVLLVVAEVQPLILVDREPAAVLQQAINFPVMLFLVLVLMALSTAVAVVLEIMAPMDMEALLYGAAAAAVVPLPTLYPLVAHHLLVGMAARVRDLATEPQERNPEVVVAPQQQAQHPAQALLAKLSSQFSRLDRGLT